MKRYFHFVFLPIVLLFSGCATFQDNSGYRAYVRVKSEPPGAPIVVRGRTVARTPALIEVPRARSNSVTLLTAEGPKEVKIQSDYRWGTSFFGNFVLLHFAPTGWVIDLATGAAWDPQDPPVTPVKLSPKEIKAAQAEKRPEVIVIPPPIASSLSISDAGGEAIEEYLKGLKTPVEPYESTLKTFISNGYDFDERPERQKARRIYRLIGATKIYESTIEPEGDHWLIRATPIDVESGERGALVEIPLKTESDYFGTLASLGWLSRLVPNAIGVDIVGDELAINQVDEDGVTTKYSFATVNEGTLWDEGLRFVSSISVSNVPPRRYGRSARWQFHFVPAFHFSRKRLRLVGLPEDPENRDVIYQRWLIAGGYGPEIGWQKSQHYLYLNLMPTLNWTEITWPGARGERSETDLGVSTRIEIGYSFFITNEWSVTLFSGTITENADIWQKVVAYRLPKRPESSSEVSFAQYGISIAYRFEPPFSSRR